MEEEDLTRSADEWGEYFKAADDQALSNYAYLKCCDWSINYNKKRRKERTEIPGDHNQY